MQNVDHTYGGTSQEHDDRDNKMKGWDPPQLERWNMGQDRAITNLLIDERKNGWSRIKNGWEIDQKASQSLRDQLELADWYVRTSQLIS